VILAREALLTLSAALSAVWFFRSLHAHHLSLYEH
jgi:hypothetical protein